MFDEGYPKFFLNPAEVKRFTESGNIAMDENGIMRIVNVPAFEGLEVVEVKRIPL